MLNSQDEELGFRSVYSVLPFEESDDNWDYFAQVSSADGEPIAFFQCSADKVDIDEYGSLIEEAKLFIDLKVYRGVRK